MDPFDDSLTHANKYQHDEFQANRIDRMEIKHQAVDMYTPLTHIYRFR